MSNNYCIILAGGTGSRLWPISRADKPKQFLDIFGTGMSMLQMTFQRFAHFLPVENIFISTFQDYKQLVIEQIPNVPQKNIIAEPHQMNTEPAIALCIAEILKQCEDANIISSPCDQLILNSLQFEEVVKKGFDFTNRTHNFLALGIQPSHPETSYGYLQVDTQILDGFPKVKTFTEKPNIDFAKVFCQSGDFFWSTGIFIWNIQSMKQLMVKEIPPIDNLFQSYSTLKDENEKTEFVNKIYTSARYRSIDFLILENNPNVYMSTATFGWADIGNWNNYYYNAQKDNTNNVTSYYNSTILNNSQENIVIIPKNKIGLIQGLEGYIVIDTGDILLICPKDDATSIRKMMNDARMNFGEKIL